MTHSKSACQSILIVEDDDAIREVIQFALEAEGYRVRAAADGKMALEVVRTTEKPCLILLDLMLPIMNGWEFLDELRKDPASVVATIPVVITSAAGGSAASAVQKAQGYIKKPIVLGMLLDEVMKFCGPGAA